jgi:hypothetical protein
MKLFHDQSIEHVGGDEPVFLLRAADAETPSIARKAAFLYRARHGASDLADELDRFADEAFEWQHAEGNSAPPPPPPEPEPAKTSPAKAAGATKKAAKKS